ncbi:hypothetical protein ACGFSG_28030 [Streptomyces sp. NPDC048512]|uniref:hypothetical protein n=1 Tax=Streptomyces sp. NPDC048512 TaxID=3365563 RepID=UPI00371C9632
MIRIVTRKRLALLEADTHAATERARQADDARGRLEAELAGAIDREEGAEATTDELGALLAHAVKQAGAAEQEILLHEIELRRVRRELAEAREAGRSVFVLLHYGTPRMIYRSVQDAYADTATHGVPADRSWVPGSRFWFDAEWCLAAFTYDAGARGFRGALTPTAVGVGGAA